MSKAIYDRYISRQFQTLVLQPITLCNLDCSYCYLPARKQRYVMSADVTIALANSIEEQGEASVDVVWHGGEPLTLSPEEFRKRLMPFEHLRKSGRLRHSVQTNATLVDDDWCQLFKDFTFHVGVSIDGPEAANLNRTDWTGRSSYPRIMRGISHLKEMQIPFSVICVVSPETIRLPRELLEFFADLGCTKVGFNIEEREAANRNRAMVDNHHAEQYWRTVIRHRRKHHRLRIRELESVASYLAKARNGRKGEWTGVLRDPIPTVAWNGNVVLLSPELAGVHSAEHSDFIVGNVLTESIPRMLDRAHEVRYVDEFLKGLAACRQECLFYDFCRGADAGNRLFEHGTFTATETAHCRNSRQALIRAFTTLTEES